jgi:hypothetical protein
MHRLILVALVVFAVMATAIPASADGEFGSRVRNMACDETASGWGTVSGEGWMKEFGVSGTTHFEIRFNQQRWDGSRWLNDERRMFESSVFPNDADNDYWDWQGQVMPASPDDEGFFIRMRIIFQWWGNDPDPTMIHRHTRTGPFCLSGGWETTAITSSPIG